MDKARPPQGARECLAQNIRERRAALGRSQEDIAEAMQLRGYRWHQATVYKVESATRALEVTEAASLAAELGVPLDRLMGDAERMRELTKIQDLMREIEGGSERIKAEGLRVVDAQISLKRLLDGLGAEWTDGSSLPALALVKSARASAGVARKPRVAMGFG